MNVRRITNLQRMGGSPWSLVAGEIVMNHD